MKKTVTNLLPSLTLALALTLAGTHPAAAQAPIPIERDPAFLAIDKAIDLKTIRPEVDVNLPRFLIQDAVSELNGGPDDPFAGAGINLADLVKDVKLIRVLVIDAGKTNLPALTRGVATLRVQLESKWTPVATVPEENVGIYALGDASGESMAGLAVLIHDGNDAIIANIVGRVSIAKVIKVVSRLDKFPKDLLQKLTGAGAAKPAPSEPAQAKSKP